MDKLYDFDICEEGLKRYGGSDKKETIIFNNERYMLKFNDDIPPEKRNDMISSSRNNVFSEYVSCHIYAALGIPVQETLLGMRHGHIVVACKDFCVNDYELNEFIKYGNSIDIDFEDQRYPEIKDVIKVIRRNKQMDPKIIEERFWDTFVIDSLLGNFDRHTGNWGYLYNEKTHDFNVAPVYDCGACLYAIVSDEGMFKILNDQEEINERIYKYPKAAFMYNGEKIDYVKFLSDKNVHDDFPLLIESLKKVSKRYDKNIVTDIIDNTPCLSSIRRTFYKTMISERYSKILEPAIETLNVSENIGQYIPSFHR